MYGKPSGFSRSVKSRQWIMRRKKDEDKLFRSFFKKVLNFENLQYILQTTVQTLFFKCRKYYLNLVRSLSPDLFKGCRISFCPLKNK